MSVCSSKNVNFLKNSCVDGKKVCVPLAWLHTLAESNSYHVASFIDATDQRPHWLMTNDHQIVALSFVFLFMVFHGSAKPHERRIASFWVRHVMLWSQPSMFSSRWICKLNLLTIRSPGNRLVWKKWFQEFYWYTYSFMLFCNCTMEPWYDFEHMRETHTNEHDVRL